MITKKLLLILRILLNEKAVVITPDNIDSYIADSCGMDEDELQDVLTREWEDV